jgi:hypothetical protein
MLRFINKLLTGQIIAIETAVGRERQKQGQIIKLFTLLNILSLSFVKKDIIRGTGKLGKKYVTGGGGAYCPTSMPSDPAPACHLTLHQHAI